MMGQAVSRPGPSEAAPHATQVHHQEVGKALTTVSSQQGRGVPSQGRGPGGHLGFGADEKTRARQVLAMGIEALAKLQDMLYAQDHWAVLVIFQAMDAAGKDGTIKHVMSGVNPQGCEVSSFKAPSDEELDHDFLWAVREAPPRARPHRHLQSLVLRGGAGGPRASGAPRARAAAHRGGAEGDPRGSLLGHPKVRAVPDPKRAWSC
jgi:hypothetical protein